MADTPPLPLTRETALALVDRVESQLVKTGEAGFYAEWQALRALLVSLSETEAPPTEDGQIVFTPAQAMLLVDGAIRDSEDSYYVVNLSVRKLQRIRAAIAAMPAPPLPEGPVRHVTDSDINRLWFAQAATNTSISPGIGFSPVLGFAHRLLTFAGMGESPVQSRAEGRVAIHHRDGTVEIDVVDAPREAQPEPSPEYVIWSGERKEFWRENSAGYTPLIAEAGRYTLAKAQAETFHCGPEKKIEIKKLQHGDMMPAPPAPGEPPQIVVGVIDLSDPEEREIETVEAMAKAIWEFPEGVHHWEETDADFKRLYRSKARRALKAALPFLHPASPPSQEEGAPVEPETARQPTIICLSGSTRFIDRMAVLAWELEKAGNIVLGCHLLPASFTEQAHHQAEFEGVGERMDELHLRKIDLCDRVLVVNLGGYIGDSTRREITYATAIGKPIAYMCEECSPVERRAPEGEK